MASGWGRGWAVEDHINATIIEAVARGDASLLKARARPPASHAAMTSQSPPPRHPGHAALHQLPTGGGPSPSSRRHQARSSKDSRPT
jgi:hypothetical protein